MSMGNGKPSSRSGTGGVLCFGHPLLDMMADVDQAFLDEYNIEPGSVNLAQESQLSLFTRLVEEHENIGLVPGGSAMNTARTLAWICPTMSISYVGSLGNDNFARILKASLDKAGVQQLFEEHDNMPTGTCAGLVTNKERSLLANLGAAVGLSLKFIRSEAVQRAVESAELYYAEGFFLNTASSPDGLVSIAKHSCSKKKTFCFNLNAPYICSAFADRIKLLMPYINILFGSDEDMLAYATVLWPEDFADVPASRPEASARDALLRIAALPTSSDRKRIVVATRGSESTLICVDGAVVAVPVPPMQPDDIVDLNGAGDSFVGGFVAKYLRTRDAAASAVVGHATAQNCIRHNGATVGGKPPVLQQ